MTSPSVQQHQINLHGKQLSFKLSGSGPAIVLFHSLLADQTSFDLITPILAKTHQVIQLSLPGFDESDFVGSSLDQISDQIAAGIQSLKLSTQPIFLGNGYGGFVALNTAIRYSELPSKLVLADCGACFSEQGRAAFKGMSDNAKKNGLAGIADIAMRRLFAPAYQELHPELIASRKERFIALNPEIFHGACHALATMDLRPQLQQLTMPVLVLVGEQDEATPPAMSEELAKLLPNAKLTILKGLAHVPQLQDPQLFLKEISEFIMI